MRDGGKTANAFSTEEIFGEWESLYNRCDAGGFVALLSCGTGRLDEIRRAVLHNYDAIPPDNPRLPAIT